MSPARRSIKRRDWPRGLREPRPGYFAWDHPDGRTLAIGRVPLAVAKNEAMLANQHVAAQKPGLIERITGAANTVAQLLEKMDVPTNPNTAKALRSLDKKIRARLGSRPVSAVQVSECAQLVEEEAGAGKRRSAQALRSRLMAAFARAVQLGWTDTNPAAPTANPKAPTQRGRLTLETYKAIRAKAPEVAEWLPLAMDLALVTGADRSTIAALERKDVGAEFLTIRRSKTGAHLEIPLRLRLEVVGLELSALVKQRTGVVSRYLVHHAKVWGNAPAGSKVFPDRISKAFTEARTLAGIPDTLPDGKGAPTFHEIRSLAKRLYLAQGNVDTKTLLGHSTDRMGDLYADPRGAEPIRVRVG